MSKDNVDVSSDLGSLLGELAKAKVEDQKKKLEKVEELNKDSSFADMMAELSQVAKTTKVKKIEKKKLLVEPEKKKEKEVTTKEERQGAELDVSFPISPNMKTNISYTHTTDSDGNHVRKVPKDKLSLNLNSKISKNIEGFFEYKYAKDLKDVVMLGDYSVLNTKFIYSLQNGINLNLKIENLLDEEYQVVNGYGTSDRAFYIGLDGAF